MKSRRLASPLPTSCLRFPAYRYLEAALRRSRRIPADEEERMHRDQRRHRLRLHSRATAVAASAALLGGVLSVTGMTASSQAAALRPDAMNGPAPTQASCHLGNGVTH